MNRSSVLTIAALLALGGTLQAQNSERRANIRGGSRDGSGKCTIEVVVDGAAQVEVRGQTAYLRNLNGQPAQWRRFECDSPMPPNPVNFQFSGVDGRGRQTLVRDPSRGGTAVVQIEDRDNGQDGYTFDLTWQGGGYQNGQYQSQRGGYPGGYQGSNQGGYQGGNQGGYNRGSGYDNGGYSNGPGRRFTAEQAVQVCQDSIREQARGQFRTDNISFRRTNIDDNPGRNDWVVGSFEVRRRGQPEVARFSCSVNFDNGRVRSAQIDGVRR